MSGVEMSGVKLSGVEMSGVELSVVEMSTFGIKIGHFNPRLYNRIYCIIPGVEMSGVEMSPTLTFIDYMLQGTIILNSGRQRHFPSYQPGTWHGFDQAELGKRSSGVGWSLRFSLQSRRLCCRDYQQPQPLLTS